LTAVLYNHIRECLPAISKEINEKIDECEDRLRELGPGLPTNNKDKMHLIWEMITHFTEQFRNEIKG
jgi:vacuolar protein sorting-associated protein 1